MNELLRFLVSYAGVFVMTLPLLIFASVKPVRSDSGLAVYNFRIYQAVFLAVFVLLLLPFSLKLLPAVPEAGSGGKGFLNLIPAAADLPAPELTAVPGTDASAAGNRFDTDLLFILLSVSGLILFCFNQIRKGVYIRNICRNIEPVLFGRMKIIISPYASTAFACGFFKKKIIIPSAYNSRAKKIAVIHEGNHHRNADPLWQTVSLFKMNLFWFNPVHYRIHKKCIHFHEILCDSKVVKTVPLNTYLHCLTDAAEMYRLANRKILSNLMAGKNRFKERIAVMLDKKRGVSGKGIKEGGKKLLKTVSGIVFVLCLLSVFTMKLSAQDSPAAKTEETGNSVRLERALELINQGEKEKAQDFLAGVDIQDFLISLDNRKDAPFQNPLRTTWQSVSMEYGENINPILNEPFFHHGIDIAVDRDTPFYPVCGGRVIETGIPPSTGDNLPMDSKAYRGNYIIIEHEFGFYSIYTHLNSFLVTEGMEVGPDTKIGTTGNTGLTTGPHLHLGIILGLDGLSLDPELFIDF